MTLNDLIKRGRDISYQLSSGDIPIVINGWTVEDIKLELRRGRMGKPYVVMRIETGENQGVAKRSGVKYSLRSKFIDMKVGEVMSVPLGQFKTVTVYNYASFIGREYGRVYTTRYDKDEKAIIVKRES